MQNNIKISPCETYKHICLANCCKGFYILCPYDAQLDKYFMLHLSPEDYQAWKKNKYEVFIKARCKWLTKDLKCLHYPERPIACKNWKCTYLKTLENFKNDSEFTTSKCHEEFKYITNKD